MNNIKLALSIVEDLRKLASSIETLAKEMQADKDIPKADMPQTEPITIEKVRAVLADKSQSGKQPEVKALITKYGANKLTEIDPSCYEELLKEASVL